MKKILLITIFIFTVVFVVMLLLATNKNTPILKKEKVAVSIFPLYDIARNIAGDEIDVVLILPPGASPHTYEPSPREVKKMSGSDAVFIVGHGIDNWAIDISDAVGVKDIKIVDKSVSLIKSNEDEDEKSSDGTDPHYFLSPKNALIIAETIKNKLVQLYPDKESVIQNNFAKYSLELIKLDKEVGIVVKDLKLKKFASFHNAWAYFARDYGLEIVTTFEEFPGEEPTPEYLKNFQKIIRQENIKAIFAEPQFSTRSLEPIAKDLGIEMTVLDPNGGVSEDRNSYVKLMEFNLLQLEKYLK